MSLAWAVPACILLTIAAVNGYSVAGVRTSIAKNGRIIVTRPYSRMPTYGSVVRRVQRLEHEMRLLKPNIKHCKNSMVGYTFATKYNASDDRKHGKIMGLTFFKKYSFTILRLRFSGNIRTYEPKKSARWFILIDGKECRNPHKVDMTMYKSTYENQLIPGVLNGMCKSTSGSEPIPAGRHSITLNVGKVPGRPTGRPFTGWTSLSTLEVQEICPPF